MPRARPDSQSVLFDELLTGDELAGPPHYVRASPDFDATAALSRGNAASTRAHDEPWGPQALLSEPLLSAGQAGALLGIPRSSVYDYAKRGELPHVRVGKHVKFIRQDLERALAERRVGI